MRSLWHVCIGSGGRAEPSLARNRFGQAPSSKGPLQVSIQGRQPPGLGPGHWPRGQLARRGLSGLGHFAAHVGAWARPERLLAEYSA